MIPYLISCVAHIYLCSGTDLTLDSVVYCLVVTTMVSRTLKVGCCRQYLSLITRITSYNCNSDTIEGFKSLPLKYRLNPMIARIDTTSISYKLD